MRAVPAFLVLTLTFPILASLALAAPPESMAFNRQPSADVRGPVRSVSVDGPGEWGAVGVADAGLQLTPEDVDLVMYNLRSQGRRWDARDTDALQEGARLVAVANGTGGQPGAWLMLVNNSVPSRLTAYRTSGIGFGNVQDTFLWQFDPVAQGGGDAGPMNAVATTNDGSLVGLATGLAAQNATYILLQNREDTQSSVQLYRARVTSAEYKDVTRFTALALNGNASMPRNVDAQRIAYAVMGAETVSSGGVLRGAIFVVETSFTSLTAPATRILLEVPTSSPVTSVDISHDGEYAVAGTNDGQVYLVSVGQALQRKNVGGINPPLRASQFSVGGAGDPVTVARIARINGELFAAGTLDGDLVVFRNQKDSSGSEGASATQVGRANANTPACRPALAGPITSLAISDLGEQLVAGTRNGLLAFEAEAHARHGLAPFEPGWCVAFDAGDLSDDSRVGVQADISADGRRVFAGTGHRVFGYRNFYCLTLTPDSTLKAGAPGQRVQWAVTVRNDGSLFDRVNLSAGGPPVEEGWEYQLSNTSLFLLPGKSQTVFLNVTPPPNLQPSNISLNLVAAPERAVRAPTENVCRANTFTNNQMTTTLRLDIGQLRRIEVRVPEETLIASAGTPNSFPITIRNLGNARDRFRVTAAIPEPQQNFKSPGSDWLLRVEPIEVEIPGQSDATVNLVVTPQAQRGDSAVVRITAEAAVPPTDGTQVSDTKQVTVAVEPTYNGDIALTENRDYRVEQGSLAYVNFTVKNLGNSRDIFVLRNRTEPPNAAGWKIQLSDERFELRTQNAVKVVRVTVTAQQGLQPGESVRVFLDLSSEGLIRQNPGADGQVDSQPATITVIPKQRRSLLPGPPDALLLVGVVAVALLAARRKED